ncbi:MAG: hypothetical protein Q7N87_03230, partial [Candidatus Uhrbacteria bacterium]|nr:hypothetical protein [Candidatus Uhrbacteria bacterium]
KSKTEKEILKFIKTIPTAVGKKKRNTSANTAYLVTAFYKSLHPNCYATSDMPKRSAKSFASLQILQNGRRCPLYSIVGRNYYGGSARQNIK